MFMKKLYLLSFSLFSVLLASCSMNDISESVSDTTDSVWNTVSDAIDETADFIDGDDDSEIIEDEYDGVDDGDMTEEMQDDVVMVGGAEMLPTNSIVDNASLSSDHTTLVTAVQTAGLVDTLNGNEEFTVFAPTNDAFNALPDGTVEALLLEENRDTLTSVLTYHVVPWAYLASDLEDGMTLTTVQGQEITFSYTDGVWYVNNAQIEIADAVANNGVVHVIDTVISPTLEDEA